MLKDKLRADKPRWLILLIDMWVVWSTYVLCYYLVFKQRGDIVWEPLSAQLITTTIVYFIFFLVFQPYRSIIHRTGLRDLQRIASTVSCAFVILAMIGWLFELAPLRNSLSPIFGKFSHTQLLLHAFMAGFFLCFMRIIYRSLYHALFWNNKGNAIPVILFGAGNMGNTTFYFLRASTRNKYRVVALLDDNPSRIGKRIQGFKVQHISALDVDFMEKHGMPRELIIAIDDHRPDRLQAVFKQAESLPLKVKIIPNSARMLAGEVATRQIRTLKVEDLLGRKPIELNNATVAQELKNKVILVTGGAGSIGSELVRQIGRSACKQLVVLDQAESALYDVQQELKPYGGFERFEFIVGNVRDEVFMESVFQQYRPQLVFHAAAYKHVPLMEANPYEAILTNVWGSYNVASLASNYRVEKFVMVSTDKAVNPTNVMGATKRIAEVSVAALNRISNTNYIVTRFGNVLGSNGSVIPLFERQIKAGGPLTLTHPDITRYFMTIPEACQLVQEAGAMGIGGEVFVFDMGKPVKIIDLAKQMIRLKGLEYPADIDIKIVGLRPGEKIFEELLANDENTAKTHHEKIMIAKVNTADVIDKMKKIEMLCALVKQLHPQEQKQQLVSLMKEIVPEFKSQNSIFAALDNEKIEVSNES
ncbi:polysaccharide biosynthesis protein [Sphingobacterium phlebotomi]|uniref:Polysaccharide biosynthesis protein n=1 Tax=Sphingobacterium phlebotomi TaxID=2605433 RepID=A0A5D4H9C4_9SPHI|nr:nucleoside-diphosphate sugar epimerase/dehydratase [Sphingobacterium phlebotomi]TYR36892.1 polysaccharide biosynthesis protein [Sphingobacterium phlebotomi]